MGYYFREWQSMGEKFRVALSSKEYCHLRQDEEGKNSGGASTQILELQCTIGRINFPKYDGSIECATRDQVGKLDTFFQLN